MSELFLYVQIKNSQLNIKYTNTVIDFVKKSKPTVLVYDIDNYSDNLTLHYATQLIKQSEKMLVFFEAEEHANFKQMMPLLTNLLDNSEKISVLINGNNERLEKLISILDYQKTKENTHEFILQETIHRVFL